jgi:predicted RecA/RadA family phage recombinase
MEAIVPATVLPLIPIGQAIPFTPPGNPAVGDCLVNGSLSAIVTPADTAVGATGRVRTDGVFLFPKRTTFGSGVALAWGTTVYWDAVNKVVSPIPSDGLCIGVTVPNSFDQVDEIPAPLDSDTTVRVMMMPGGPAGGATPAFQPAKVSIHYTAGPTSFKPGEITGAAYVIVINTNAAPGTITTPKASAMFAAIPGAYKGLTYRLRIVNAGAGLLTLAAGTGVTFIGTHTVSQNTTRDFVVTFITATTAQFQEAGTNASSLSAQPMPAPPSVTPANNPALLGWMDPFSLPNSDTLYSASAPAIARATLRTPSTGGCIDIAGYAVTSDTTFDAAGGDAALAATTTLNLDTAGFCNVVLSGLLANSMYLVWPKNHFGYGIPWAVNRTQAWWLQGSSVGDTRVYVGDTVTVLGDNLQQLGSSPGRCGVYIEPAAGGAGQWIDVTGHNSLVCTCGVQFLMPNVALGVWNVWLHNGHGGIYGWSGPLKLTVTTPTAQGFNYGATTYTMPAPSGGDDHAAFITALTTIGLGNPGTIDLGSAVRTYQSASLLDTTGYPVLIKGAGRRTGSVTGATNATPIMINSVAHGLAVNDIVTIVGVGGNTAANGSWNVAAIVDADHFSLTSSIGNGNYTSGGTWEGAPKTVIKTTGAINGPTMLVLDPKGALQDLKVSTVGDGTFTTGTGQGIIRGGRSFVNVDSDTRNVYDAISGEAFGIAHSGQSGICYQNCNITGNGIALVNCAGVIFIDDHWRISNLMEMAVHNQGSHDILETVGATGTGCINQDLDRLGDPGIGTTGRTRGQGRVIFQEAGSGRVYNVACLNNPTLSIQYGNPPDQPQGKGEQISGEASASWLSAFASAASNSPPSISYNADRVVLTICQGTDLVIDGSDNTIVRSASRPFVNADTLNGGIWVIVTHGTGFTIPAAYQVVALASGGGAKLSGPVGTLGSTGGTWATGASLGIAKGTDGSIAAANTSSPVISSAYQFVTADVGRCIYLRHAQVTGGGKVAYINSVAGGLATLDSAVSGSASLSGVTWGTFPNLVSDAEVVVMGGKGATQCAIILGLTGDASNITYTLDRPWNLVPDPTSVVNLTQSYSRVICFNNGMEGLYNTDPSASGFIFQFFAGANDLILDCGPNGYIRGVPYVGTMGFTSDVLTGLSFGGGNIRCTIPSFFNWFRNLNVSNCLHGVQVVGGGAGDPGATVGWFGDKVTNMNATGITYNHFQFNGPVSYGYFTIEICNCQDAPVAIDELQSTDSDNPTAFYILQNNNFRLGSAPRSGSFGIKHDQIPLMHTVPIMPPYHQFHGFETNSDP